MLKKLAMLAVAAIIGLSSFAVSSVSEACGCNNSNYYCGDGYGCY